MVDGSSVKAEGISCKTSTGEVLRVREVWQDNLTDEMDLIRQIVDDYPFLAMDTEFPGVVARPVGNFKNSGEYHYQTLRYTGFAFQSHLVVAKGLVRLRSIQLPPCVGSTWTC